MNKKKEKKNTAAEKTRPRCPQCGYRTRGQQHEDGYHHKHGSSGRAAMRRY